MSWISPKNKKRFKKIALVSTISALVVLLGVSGYLLSVAWVALGHAPDASLLKKMEASPRFSSGKFQNSQPMYNNVWAMLTDVRNKSDYSAPASPLPTLTPNFSQPLPREDLRVTWLGHSTTVIEIDGVRVLTDPVFGPTASPFKNLGPKRWYAPPAALSTLGKIDVVLISHDHYDHLDQPTISQIKDWDATFVAPLGVAAHLIYWGIPEDRIMSVDWWDELDLGALHLVVTPSRHASGRQVFDQMRTLWAGYALIGPKHRVYFSGDTGFFDDLSVIGERLGPFDITMVEVGAYNRAWPDWHMGPEQAVIAHQKLRGRLFLPIHWGLFDLAYHSWTEPMERVVLEAERRNVPYLTLRPGEQVRPEGPHPKTRWWPKVPFKTKEQAPILATLNGDPSQRYKHDEP